MRTLLLTAWLGVVWLRPFVAEAVTPHLHWLVQFALIGLSLWLCWSLPAPAQPDPRGLSLALGGWLIVSVLALLAAARATLAVTTWLQVIAPAILVPVVWRLEARGIRQLLLALCLGGLLIAVFALLQYFIILPHLTSLPDEMEAGEAIQEVAARRRVLGTFPLPNLFAGYMGMLLPLAAGLLRSREMPRRQVTLVACAVVLMAVAFLLAQSLGATLALVVASGLVLLRRRGGLGGRHALAWAAAGLLVLGILFAARPMLREFSDAHNPFRNRLAYWQVTASMIRERPLLGVGLGQFREHYDALRPPEGRRVIHAHNSYLELWAEMGLAGLLCWVGILVAALRRAHRHDGWLAVAVWMFVLHNTVDFSLYDPQVNVLWWLLLGLVIRPRSGSDPS